jgi:hypothetical protein
LYNRFLRSGSWYQLSILKRDYEEKKREIRTEEAAAELEEARALIAWGSGSATQQLHILQFLTQTPTQESCTHNDNHHHCHSSSPYDCRCADLTGDRRASSRSCETSTSSRTTRFTRFSVRELSRDILSRVCRDAKLGKISEKSVEVLSFR